MRKDVGCVLGKKSTGWRPQQDGLKTVSVLLSVTLVMWVTCKSWAFVMELTTHTWQRSLGSLRGGTVVVAAGAGPPCLASLKYMGRSMGAGYRGASLLVPLRAAQESPVVHPNPKQIGKEILWFSLAKLKHYKEKL